MTATLVTVCPVCERPMAPTDERGRPKRVCSRPCARALGGMATHKCHHRVEDVSELLEAGESPTQIARRLDLKPTTLARSLERGGRPDLARPFYRLDPRWHRDDWRSA